MILGIGGGSFLAVGSFLRWATGAVDIDKIAGVLGIDPAQLPAGLRATGTASITGLDIGPGRWMLVTGAVVVIASALLALRSSTQVLALVMIFGGAVGGSMALYQATVGKDGMIDDVARVLIGAPLPGSLHTYVSVSIGIGIWLCVIGGVVAIVGGIMAMLRGTPSRSSMDTPAAGEAPPGTS
jgi:hypothetical protein